MPEYILMPSLSPSMTEGTLSRWLKAEGDPVKAGEAIAEIETDKATLEFAAPSAGVVAKLLVAAGTSVPVRAPIALLLGEREDAPSAPPAVTPRIFASPIARRLAREGGIGLATLAGTGPNGRIVRADVERARAAAGAPGAIAGGPGDRARPAASVAAAPRPMPWQATTPVPNTAARKVLARRLLEAKQGVPHYYLTVDVEVDALLDLRTRLNSRPGAGYKLTINDFVVKAVALALRRVPAANAMWSEEAVLRFAAVDVAVAVSTETGLVTPVVRDADRKSLVAISGEARELSARARAGKLLPEEYQGGGFTVTNLGMYGVREFAAIINPPHSGILAVGAAEPRPVAREGAVVVRTLMTCTLSADHRTVDGAVGAELLSAFKSNVEDPLGLLL